MNGFKRQVGRYAGTRLFSPLMALAVLACAGCVTHETRPQPRLNAIQAAAEIPESELLDVGVRLFDENVPDDEKKREKERIFPEVRKAEARFQRGSGARRVAYVLFGTCRP